MFRPGSIQLEIDRTDRVAEIDFRRGRFSIENKSNAHQKIAGRLPAEELLFFLKQPFGADMLNITSCFFVLDEQRWQQLLSFRHGLYVFHNYRFIKQAKQWLGYCYRTKLANR